MRSVGCNLERIVLPVTYLKGLIMEVSEANCLVPAEFGDKLGVGI
jgi:hypothetical protein